MRASAPFAPFVFALFATALAPCTLHAQRSADPVVTTGAKLPELLGMKPGKIVGFRHTASAGWEQIPIQIDERAVVGFDQIRRISRINFKTLVYTDADTWTGADPNANFDADDELVFMARDTGGPAGLGDPAGVVPGRRVGLAVEDPISKALRYVYFFESAGQLVPGAGKRLVNYEFKLTSGNYKSTFDLSGRNPETSSVTSRRYKLGFSAEWILDRLENHTGSSTGVDILDRHKFQFAPGVCGRTTGTFSNGPGAFIANKSGPVRAIRSVVGANSGTVTQRDWIFYEQRVDIVSYLRVHRIGGTWFFFDWSPLAAGMTYYDDHNEGGFAVDGKPDAWRAGALSYQFLTGKQGSIVNAIRIDTDIPGFQSTSYYDDDTTPSWMQCTGAGFAYAAAGPRTSALPNTDPLRGTANNLTGYSIVYFAAPGLNLAAAKRLAASGRTPLTTRPSPGRTLFGTACVGTAGGPALDLLGAPETGRTVSFQVQKLPASQWGFLHIGDSRTQWGALRLPLDLTPFGMNGCSLYSSILIQLAAQSSASGASFPLPIPNDASLNGVMLFLQYMGIDTRANATGLVTSNGLSTSIRG